MKIKKGIKSRIFTNFFKISANIGERLIIIPKFYALFPEKLYKKVINKQRQYIDWDKTIAYGENKGIKGIKILKFKGREEYEEIREKIIEGLKRIKDPKTGEKIIREAYKKEDIYSGPFLEKISDIVILQNPDYRIHHFFYDTIVKSYKPVIAGNHLAHLEGIFIAYGSDIKKGIKIQNAKIYDIAPTILHIFGVPIPRDMDGLVLKEIFEESSELAKRPIRYEEEGEKEKIREKVKMLTMQKRI